MDERKEQKSRRAGEQESKKERGRKMKRGRRKSVVGAWTVTMGGGGGPDGRRGGVYLSERELSACRHARSFEFPGDRTLNPLDLSRKYVVIVLPFWSPVLTLPEMSAE